MERIIKTSVITKFAITRAEYILITNRNERAAKLLSLFENVHTEKLSKLSDTALSRDGFDANAKLTQHYTRKQLNLYSFGSDFNKISKQMYLLRDMGFIEVEQTKEGNVLTGFDVLFKTIEVQNAVNEALNEYMIFKPLLNTYVFDQVKFYNWYYQLDGKDALDESDIIEIQTDTPPIHLNLPPSIQTNVPPIHLNLPLNSNELTYNNTINDSKLHTHTEIFENFEKDDFVKKGTGGAAKNDPNTRRLYGYDVEKICADLKELYLKSENHRTALKNAFDQYSVPAESRQEMFKLYSFKFVSQILKKKKDEFYKRSPQTAVFETYLSLQEIHTDFLAAFGWLVKCNYSNTPKTDKEKKQKESRPVIEAPTNSIKSDVLTESSKPVVPLAVKKTDITAFNYNYNRLYDDTFINFLSRLKIVILKWHVVGHGVEIENAETEYQFWVKLLSLDEDKQEGFFIEAKKKEAEKVLKSRGVV